MLKAIVVKLKESIFSVLPIYTLVMIISFTPLVTLTTEEMLIFTFSTVLVIVGITLFNLGADIAMTPMGKLTGNGLTKHGKFKVLLIACFLLGFFITIAEPDLSVLATQTATVFNPTVLLIGVGIGVAIFLVVSILRTIYKVNLSHLLMFSYMILFALTIIVILTGKEEIIGLAFDSGGVTTGPITVPFLMALGVGVSSIISNKSDKDASFGLVALCSVGPIMVILVMSIFSKGEISYVLGNYDLSQNIFQNLLSHLLDKTLSVTIALGLIVLCFFICNFFFLKINKKKIKQIIVGVLYTYLGLIIFLTAVETSYMSIGYKIGSSLASFNTTWLIIIGFIIGALVVLAEPAVHVLNSQVEEITGGLVKKKKMMIALTIGVGIAICLAMIRIVYKFSLLYYLIPGLILCLGLSFFVPKIYIAIAFDSGGVASGPLTSTFILPLAIGACNVLNGENEILNFAFGVVSLVATTPLITIEILGLIAIIKDKVKNKKAIKKVQMSDDKIIIKFM